MPVFVELQCRKTEAARCWQDRIFEQDGQKYEVISAGTADQPSTFHRNFFFSRLHTQCLGSALLTTPLMPSTQTFLHGQFSKAGDGAVCLADAQTLGKGRGKNTWTSPEGCLMFSVYKTLSIAGKRMEEQKSAIACLILDVLRMSKDTTDLPSSEKGMPSTARATFAGKQLPFVQYAASLAIVQAVRAAAKRRGQTQAPDILIKWPNDIYAKHLKIGGILCQTIHREGAFHLILGVGLNVTNAAPTTCLSEILGLQRFEKQLFREEVLADILNNLEVLLETLCSKGFGPIRPSYLQAWMHTDQKVTIEEEKEGKRHAIILTVLGISENGYLAAVDSNGEIFELHPDGNSLDFFQGLVRRKL